MGKFNESFDTIMNEFEKMSDDEFNSMFKINEPPYIHVMDHDPSIKLVILDDRTLGINNDTVLLYEYPAGDFDTIDWDNLNVDHLRGALYDAREIGDLPGHQRSVILPDDTVFYID